MHHLFVVNPHSFLDEKELERILDRLSSSPVKGDIHISKYIREAVPFVRKYIRALKPEERVRVYSVGGDGILYDCLNGIMTSRPDAAELAILPFGANNDVMRTLAFQAGFTSHHPWGGFFDLFRDIDAQIEAPTTDIDVLKVGSHYALNICGLGIEAACTLAFRLWGKKAWKLSPSLHLYQQVVHPIFILGAVFSILSRKFASPYYHIDIDGEHREGYYSVIHITNGPSLGGEMTVTPEAKINDGILDSAFVQDTEARSPQKGNPFKRLKIMRDFIHGRGNRHPQDVHFYQARCFHIEASEAFLLNVDNEVFSETKVDIEVLPRALHLVWPEGWGNL